MVVVNSYTVNGEEYTMSLFHIAVCNDTYILKISKERSGWAYTLAVVTLVSLLYLGRDNVPTYEAGILQGFQALYQITKFGA